MKGTVREKKWSERGREKKKERKKERTKRKKERNSKMQYENACLYGKMKDLVTFPKYEMQIHDKSQNLRFACFDSKDN